MSTDWSTCNSLYVLYTQALLQETALEEAIRAGDCLAMLVEHYHGQRQSTEAFHYLQEMEARRIQLHPYLDAAVIDDIYRAVGHNPNAPKKPTGSRSSPDPDDDYLGGGRGSAGGSGKETQNRWSAEEEGVDEDIDEVCMCLLPILLGILHIYLCMCLTLCVCRRSRRK